MSAPSWIAVDWGTSNLRAWLMDDADGVIDARHSPQGMASLARHEFADVLTALIGHTDIPVVACGMVGSRQGWAEAPYVTVPCQPPGLKDATRIGAVQILPGVKQDRPADVMRGEETQIKGFLAAHPQFDGVLCLPGTHTKWVHVSAGEIVSFRTAMTGEFFDLIAHQSVLRHSLDDAWDPSAFETAIADGMSRPQDLASAFFSIRATGLLTQVPAGTARARLSGLLIGAELAAMRPYWLGQAVAVIGVERLVNLYGSALSAQGVSASVVSGDEMTLRGLVAARAELEVL